MGRGHRGLDRAAAEGGRPSAGAHSRCAGQVCRAGAHGRCARQVHTARTLGRPRSCAPWSLPPRRARAKPAGRKCKCQPPPPRSPPQQHPHPHPHPHPPRLHTLRLPEASPARHSLPPGAQGARARPRPPGGVQEDSPPEPLQRPWQGGALGTWHWTRHAARAPSDPGNTPWGSPSPGIRRAGPRGGPPQSRPGGAHPRAAPTAHGPQPWARTVPGT